MRSKLALYAGFLAALIWFQTAFLERSYVSSAAPVADSSLYLPLVSRSIPEDLVVDRLIISQAVQDIGSSVPLVAQRNTVVRVFARRIEGNIPGNITVSLSATRGSSPLGTLVSAPRSVPDSPSQAVLESTFNFILPGSWLLGNISLVATVDSADVVMETNEANNVLRRDFSFNVVPPLTIKIVPVRYTHTGSRAGTYAGQQSDVTGWIRRTFPVSSVNVEFHPTGIDFIGNLEQSNEWGRLLQAATNLKNMELGQSNPTVYYALVPISNGVNRWFNGGVAGIGWVGARVSAGLNLSSAFGTESASILAAHEIGHNFGRHHAPCGVTTNDPYPYAGASIGQYGLDIKGNSFVLIRPEDNYVDMMSYCSPEWISDFTYEALYVDQLASGLSLSGPLKDSLMIRASFDETGLPSLQPLYIVTQPISPPQPTPEGYAVELLDGDGRVIDDYPVKVWLAGEPELTLRAIHAVVPLPDTPVAAVRLVQAGKTVALRALNSPDHPLQLEAIAVAPSLTEAGQTSLVWNAPDTPAMLRYSADGGQSWISLGIDVLDGKLMLDSSRLPGKSGQFEITMADSATSAGSTVVLTTP